MSQHTSFPIGVVVLEQALYGAFPVLSHASL